MRRILLLVAISTAVFLAWLKWRDRPTAQASAPIIVRQAVNFANREFDPVRPPAEMPRMAFGEEAECDANFTSRASVAGQSQKTDATHAAVTVTQVRMTLGLDVTIWAPIGATQHVMDHEEGHRQIAEKYYDTADKVAARVAAKYVGQQIPISGGNLDAELNNALQKISSEINDEYNRELDSGPAQLRYDAITDHARNDVPAPSAIAQALASNPPN